MLEANEAGEGKEKGRVHRESGKFYVFPRITAHFYQKSTFKRE